MISEDLDAWSNRPKEKGSITEADGRSVAYLEDAVEKARFRSELGNASDNESFVRYLIRRNGILSSNGTCW